jgi:uncharacterized membrane protein
MTIGAVEVKKIFEIIIGLVFVFCDNCILVDFLLWSRHVLWGFPFRFSSGVIGGSIIFGLEILWIVFALKDNDDNW